MLGDDVDRTDRIRSLGFAEANPDRMCVHRVRWDDRWHVFRGDRYWGDYGTHAEAITVAHSLAGPT